MPFADTALNHFLFTYYVTSDEASDYILIPFYSYLTTRQPLVWQRSVQYIPNTYPNNENGAEGLGMGWRTPLQIHFLIAL